MINIEYYKEFIEIAKARNFSTVSEQLFISQSSLSKHIAALEKELGVHLFNRNTRSVELSDFGIAILPYVQKLVEMDDRIRQTANERYLWKSAGEPNSTLKIASIPVMAEYKITNAVAYYHKKYPYTSISISDIEPAKIPDLLDSRKFELAFVRTGDQLGKKYDCVEFCREQIVAVLPAHHPLARKSRISLSELKEEKFLLIAEQAEFHNICINLCIQAGFTPDISFTSLRLGNIISLVSQGMGVSLFTDAFYEYYHQPEVVGVNITPSIETGICLIKRKGAPLSSAAQKFWNHIEACSRRSLLAATFPKN